MTAPDRDRDRDRGGKFQKKRSSISTIDTSSTPFRKQEHVAAPPVERPNSMKVPPRYENSFQLKPRKRFPQHQVYLLIQETLQTHLANETYEAAKCALLTKKISEEVKAKVLEVNPSRFKVVCLVTIGQMAQQGIIVSSRCLWDAKSDNFASSEFNNASLFAVASVYAVYTE